ncbi:MAG: PAQR family membrane homeostasis protein TrhA [Candidatus Dormibacteria bacterium]|nr:hemolysin III family protein [Candidatus Saccharimonadales bacterium]
MRGWTHLATVPIAIAGAIALVVVSGGNVARQISLGIYGVCLILLFAVSASYHRGPWSMRTRRVWGRLDHATIFLAIAGTYTPIVVNVLQGWPSIVLLVVIWALAGSGVIVATTGIPLPRWVTVVLYLGVGWTVVFFLPALGDRIHTSGLVVLAAGGALYCAGAIVYALKRPRLWPKVFGYHEVFHILVIAATAVYFVFIMRTVAMQR